MRRCWNCKNYHRCDKHKYGVVSDCTSYVRTANQQEIRVNFLNAAIKEDESDGEDCTIFPAETLPGGWTWYCWNDGSGHLESPAGNSLFSYDTNPYANCGEIEYRKDRNSGWTTFECGLTSFRQFAEEVILKQMQR